MQRIITIEQKGVMEDTTFRKTAEWLVIKSGIRADLNGCKCLADAVILYGTKMCSRFGEIYDITGQYRDIRPKSVIRDIGYAIRQAYDLPSKLSDMVGVKIPKTEIHSGLVIAYLGTIFRDPAHFGLACENS